MYNIYIYVHYKLYNIQFIQYTIYIIQYTYMLYYVFDCNVLAF